MHLSPIGSITSTRLELSETLLAEGRGVALVRWSQSHNSGPPQSRSEKKTKERPSSSYKNKSRTRIPRCFIQPECSLIFHSKNITLRDFNSTFDPETERGKAVYTVLGESTPSTFIINRHTVTNVRIIVSNKRTPKDDMLKCFTFLYIQIIFRFLFW